MSISTSNVYLLDTNAVVARTKNDQTLIHMLSDTEIIVSSITLGELYFGAFKSARVEENLRQIEEFIWARTILNCDKETAQIYGRIRQQLRSKGRPIPQNDVWIAAIALQHDLVLVTRDAHFEQVDGLKTRSW